MRRSKKRSGSLVSAWRRTNVLRLESLEPRTLLSGGSLDDLLTISPPPQVDLPSVWMPDSSVSEPAAGETLLVEGAAQESSELLDAFTYDTLPNGMPILHSLLGAPASIFLDFDGYDPEGWLPFTQDTGGTTFNTTEQATIIETWRQIEAYYSMFDIDVTTIQPDVYSQPTSWHVITPSYKNGGLAWGIFPNTTPGSLVDGDWAPFNIQQAIAHEVGHTFGCGHIAKYDELGKVTETYAIFDDRLRGSIMGGCGNVVNKWYLWHAEAWANPGGPSYLQNDLSYIATLIDSKAYSGYTGDGYRPDDYAGAIAAATPLAVDGSTQSITGIVERLTDADAFSFTVSAAGRYCIAATREEPAGVDLKLSIYNSSGVLIAARDGDPREQPKSLVNDEYLTLDLSVPGTYYAVVESHGNYADLGKYHLRVDPLPGAWTLDKVGLNARAGYATYDAGSDTYTLAGAGYYILGTTTTSSIGGTNDSFHYLYQTLQGDGSITVRVSSLGATQNPKAGIMIRDSLDSNAKSASLVLTSSSRAYFYYRSATGGSTSSSYATATTSYLLRLTRTGDVFRAEVSGNGGSTWTQVGTDRTIAMGQTVYIGLVSTANCTSAGTKNDPTNHALNVATMTSVSLTGTLNPAPTLNGLAAPTGLTVTGKTSASISLSWSDVADETGYSIERSTDGINYAAVGAVAADVTAYTDSALVDSDSGLPLYQRYFYRVRAQGTGGTVSQASGFVSDFPRAGPISNMVVNSISTSQIVLDWQDASGEVSYRIERSADGASGWTTVGSVGRNVPSFTNSGLPAATQYYYRVVTVDAAGDAATSAVVTGCSRLNMVTGLRLTNVSYEGISLAWNSVTGATSYRIERSTDGGTTYTTRASGVTSTSYTDTSVTWGQEYYYRVIGVNSLTESTSASSSVHTTVMPNPWATLDIGAVGVAGSTSYSSGTFTIEASGADITGTLDEFRFVYEELPGDGEIIARVASIENTSSRAKAGVMIRDSLDADSAHAGTFITYSLGARFLRRLTTGGTTASTSSFGAAAPYWVKMTRAGNLFTSAISPDGATWTTVGSATIAMTGSVYIGLAVTSRDDTTLCTATFTDVSVIAAPVVVTAAAATPNPTVTTTTVLSALGGDNGGESHLTYTWAAASLPPGASEPTYSATNGTNAGKNVTATFSQAGTYAMRVTIRDEGGLTVTSDVVVDVVATMTSIVVAPNPVTLYYEGTQQFAAVAYDQFGAAISPQPAFTWSAVSGEITADGLYTAPTAPVVDTVTATSGSVHGASQVTVLPVPLPEPWLSQDVGSVPMAGGTTWDHGTFTVQGCGGNI